jgi:hypothetical protein
MLDVGPPEGVLPGELLAAELALVSLDVVVDRFDVVLQVVGLLEGPLAHGALERAEPWKRIQIKLYTFSRIIKEYKIIMTP